MAKIDLTEKELQQIRHWATYSIEREKIGAEEVEDTPDRKLIKFWAGIIKKVDKALG